MRTTLPPLRALLYAGVVAIANPAQAADLSDLRIGDMKKLVIHDAGKETSDETFTAPSGDLVRLGDFEGRVVLLNFWATWCAPCRKEMPMLDALQAEMGGDAFEVLIVATGKNNPAAIDKFFQKHGITTLQSHLDPKSALARDMGIFGLPITVILNREGMEIARLRGDADWASDEAKALLQAVIDGAAHGS